jgi:hypothetical protein
MLEACESMTQTEAYLSGSEDPTKLYLEQGLSKLRQTAALWVVAKGNSTSSFRGLMLAKRRCDILERVLLSLGEKAGDSTLTDGWLQKAKDYLSRSLPQCHRLSALIDEALHIDRCEFTLAKAS